METTIASLVETHFQEMGFRYFTDPDAPVGPKFTLSLGLRNGLVQVVATCLEEEAALTVSFHTSVCAPTFARLEMALLVARLNQGLRLGRFEFDVERGYVGFSAHVEFGNATPQLSMLVPLFAGGSCILDDALPALNAVAYGNMPADRAEMLRQCLASEREVEALDDPEFIDLMERLMGEDEVDIGGADRNTDDGIEWGDWEDMPGQPGLFGDDPA